MKIILSTVVLFVLLNNASAQIQSLDTLKHFQYSDTSFEVGEVRILKSVYFNFDSDSLRPESSNGLDSLVDFLKKHTYVCMEIAKHHESHKRSSDFDMNLSKRRAEVICNYLISHGIPKDRLSYKGLLESPLIYVYTDLGFDVTYARRIEIKITCLSNK